MTSAARKILVIGPSWVGDMVMAQSLFIALSQRHPGCIIDVLAPHWSLPVLERMPEVRRGISMPIGHGKLALGQRRSIGNGLRREQYQQAIVLPNSLKSALIPWFANIALRTGWRGEMRYGLLNDIRLLIKKNYPLMVQRFVALAYDSDLPADSPLLEFANIPRPCLQIDSANTEAVLQRFDLQQQLPILALCPGAEFGAAKRWPEQHYANVAEEFIHRGWSVVLLGSTNDADVTQSIMQAIPEAARHRCIDVAGKTALSEAIDLLSTADAVVSNDSGLMHIAAALNRPMVVVYGSTSADFTPPLSESVGIVQLDLQCRPCFQRQCPFTDAQQHLQCLTQLAPAKVISALDRLL